jgi:hypothetical protein
MDVMSIEDQLECGVGSHGEMESEALAEVRRKIDKMIVEAKKKVPGGGYNIRKIVNAKNVWGFYCIWHFGGYHMDTAIYPEPPRTVFPEPLHFGLPCLSKTQSRVFNFPSRGQRLGTTSIILDDSNISTMVFPNGNVVRETTLKKTPLVDVWLMRSQKGGATSKLALDWYLNTIDIINKNLEVCENNALYKSASRMAVCSAAATAICRANGGRGLKHPRDIEKHLIETKIGSNNVLPEIGVRKIGFQSHRK